MAGPAFPPPVNANLAKDPAPVRLGDGLATIEEIVVYARFSSHPGAAFVGLEANGRSYNLEGLFDIEYQGGLHALRYRGRIPVQGLVTFSPPSPLPWEAMVFAHVKYRLRGCDNRDGEVIVKRILV